MHDWTRVPDGIFHAFHNSWITHLQEALNAELLPPSYYALGEQRAGDVEPDLLTLRSAEDATDAEAFDDPSREPVRKPDSQDQNDQKNGGMIALADAPPRVSLVERAEDVSFYLSRQRHLAIRHVSGDPIVALVEIVSAANKHTAQTLDDFADKVVAALRAGIHVLVIDPQPPTRNDPDGIHGLGAVRAPVFAPPIASTRERCEPHSEPGGFPGEMKIWLDWPD
jgi:hypothetical protein